MFCRKSTRAAQKNGPSHRNNVRHFRRSLLLLAMRLEERVLLSGSAQALPGQVIAANPSVVLPAALSKAAQPLTIGSSIDPSLTPARTTSTRSSQLRTDA